jgi:hypothetical protein
MELRGLRPIKGRSAQHAQACGLRLPPGKRFGKAIAILLCARRPIAALAAALNSSRPIPFAGLLRGCQIRLPRGTTLTPHFALASETEWNVRLPLRPSIRKRTTPWRAL